MSADLPRSAIWYARHGWYVFPVHEAIFVGGVCVGCSCEPWRRSDECRVKMPYYALAQNEKCENPGKCPRVRWRDRSTTDEDVIGRWWRAWPQANIGIDCGKSGILALDADLYKDTFAGDLSQFDDETLTSLTGGGGTHLIYHMPEEATYGNNSAGLPPGIDIRGHGGFIIAPPSLHKSGRRYQWEAGFGPHEIDPKPMPDKLRATLDAGRAQVRIAGPPDCRAVAEAEKIVQSVLDMLEMNADGPHQYDQSGRRWILKDCPYNPEGNPHGKDRAAYIIVARDGHISAGCQHARCRERLHSLDSSGWKFLVKRAAGLVR